MTQQDGALMQSDDHGVTPQSSSADREQATAKTPAGKARHSRSLVLAACGLLGATAAALLMTQFEEFFQMETVVIISEEMKQKIQSGEIQGGAAMGAIMAENDLGEVGRKAIEQRRIVEWKNTILSATLLGTAVCALLGLGEGIARRSPLMAFIAFLAGAPVGAIFGATGGAGAMLVNERLRQSQLLPETAQPLITQAVVWMFLAVAIGSVLVLASRRSAPFFRTLGAAVLGGVAGLILYQVVAPFAFPLDRADLAVPEGLGNRLLWAGSCATLIGLACGWVSARLPAQPVPSHDE